MEINIDFDGTCTTHAFPAIGKDIGAVPILKKSVSSGHRLILFTMRSNKKGTSLVTNKTEFGGLSDAVKWFEDNDIPLCGIQTNPTQSSWTESPKSYAPLMIDDSALGCPLKTDFSISDRPFVDWSKVEDLLISKELIQ